MKRTGEFVLSIVGMVIYFFTIVLGIVLMIVLDDEKSVEEVESTLREGDSNMGSEDVNLVLDFMGSYNWALVIVSILAIILGIIAVVLLRDNKKPIISGVLLLAAAVVGGILTLPFGLLSGLFYLIAGIMCLARKPKPQLE